MSAPKSYVPMILIVTSVIVLTAIGYLLRTEEPVRLSPDEAAELERRVIEQGTYTKPERKAGHIYIGMSRQDVASVWGQPAKRHSQLSANHLDEAWLYKDHTLLFRDGILRVINATN